MQIRPYKYFMRTYVSVITALFSLQKRAAPLTINTLHGYLTQAFCFLYWRCYLLIFHPKSVHLDLKFAFTAKLTLNRLRIITRKRHCIIFNANMCNVEKRHWLKWCFSVIVSEYCSIYFRPWFLCKLAAFIRAKSVLVHQYVESVNNQNHWMPPHPPPILCWTSMQNIIQSLSLFGDVSLFDCWEENVIFLTQIPLLF